MPSGVDERLWRRAKKLAQKQRPKARDLYALAMHIYQNMKVEKAETAEARRIRNAKPSNRAARREYMHTEDGRAANRKAKENYRKRHPDRTRAHHKASTDHGSGRGCEICGKPAVKHHESYGSRKVRWLCHEHHVKAHHPKSNLGEGNKAMGTTDKIHGGLADKKKPGDFDQRQLAIGTKVELEHTNDRAVAQEIAMDHLTEDKQYYQKLAIMERQGKVKKSDRKSLDATGTPSKGAFVIKGETGAADLGHKSPPKEHRKTGATNASDYADPATYRYPLHRESNVRAAISYFSMPRNYSKYSPEKRAEVWGRIMGAAKKHGIEVADRSVPGSKEKEKSMSEVDVFKSIMSRDPLAEAEATESSLDGMLKSLEDAKSTLEKSGFFAHPRPGLTTAMAATDGGDPGVENHQSTGMVPAPRPGAATAMDKSDAKDDSASDKMDDEVNEAMKALDKAIAVMKALVGRNVMGEGLRAGGDSTGATRTLPGGPSMPQPHDKMNGLPAAPSASSEQFSDDDRPESQQMSPGKKPIEMDAEGGAPGMQASVNQKLSKSGALGADADVERDRAAYANNPNRDSQLDRMVHYSNTSDAHIEQLIAKSEANGRGSHALGEPVLHNRQSPLLKSYVCPDCNSSVSAVLTKCDVCGHDRLSKRTQGALVQKSVLDSLAGPTDQRRYYPNGLEIEE